MSRGAVHRRGRGVCREGGELQNENEGVRLSNVGASFLYGKDALTPETAPVQ